MLRRSSLALSRRRLSIVYSTPQIFSSVCSRRKFSSVPPKNASPRPSSTSKPSERGNNLTKVIVGSVAAGACFYAAYSRGYLNDFIGLKQQSSDPLKADDSNSESLKGDRGLHESEHVKEHVPVHTSTESENLNSHVKDADERTEKQSTMDLLGDSRKDEGGSDSFAENSSNSTTESFTPVKELDLPKTSGDIHTESEKLSKSSADETAKDEYLSSQNLVEHSEDTKSPGGKVHLEGHETDANLSTINDVDVVVQGKDLDKDETAEWKLQNEHKDIHGPEVESSASLADKYPSEAKVDEHIINNLLSAEETPSSSVGDSYVTKDGKLILDFLQAIHAAEQRQAELDARFFAEEKRAMKDKYEKELKDARARELMYAEEAAMLEKEVKKERAKAAAALKSLQERAEERLKKELEEKEKEAEIKLMEAQDFAKAELAASIAREKAAHIEKMAEANVNINALCMAFYARSEEARQTHSIHKLALGALALEDALSNGQPIQSELETLQLYIENVDKDSLLQLALSSIPEDVRHHGSDTLLQLNQKFNSLKGKLRHFSLIPPNGGGILAHSLARVASFLKVKEADQSGDGIESVLNRVESLLAQGKLAEAADVLEDGVKGSKAAEVVGDWLTSARNRAITEQALVLVQSYAASVSLT